MPEDQQRAAAMRMAMGILANNTESRPGAGNAFGRAMAGGMDEGALYANQVAQQQRMAQQMEQQQQMMEMQRQKMAEDAAEREHVQKYYGIASQELAKGNMPGVIQNVSQANPAMGFNMAFQQMQNQQAQSARAQERADEMKFREAEKRQAHEWRQEDMRLQRALAGAQIAASRAAGIKPEYKTDANTGEVMALVGDKAYPVTRGDGKTVKATVAGMPVGNDGNLEAPEPPKGMKNVPMPKKPTTAQIYKAQETMQAAVSVNTILQQQQELHKRLVEKYGTGWQARLMQKANLKLGNDNDLNRYNANLISLANTKLSMQNGNQTDSDYIRALDELQQAHMPEASHAAIIARMKEANMRTIHNNEAFIAGYTLAPAGKDKPKTPPTGNEEVLEWSDYK
jgi:hypothetical protein